MGSRSLISNPTAGTVAKRARGAVRILVALKSPLDCQLLMAAAKSSSQTFDSVFALSKSDILYCLSRNTFDVALISSDLEDGPTAGLQVLPQIHAHHPKTPIIIIFDKLQDDLVVQAFCGGAKGVFSRSEKQLDSLWKCIQAVHKGQVWADSGQLRLLLNTLMRSTITRPAQSRVTNLLAIREAEVANLVAESLSNKEIARKLGISEHTVSNYLFRIYNKLGISSRVELVLYLMKQREAPTAAD